MRGGVTPGPLGEEYAGYFQRNSGVLGTRHPENQRVRPGSRDERLAVDTVELRAQLPELTASPSARIIAMRTFTKMKPILSTLTVLTLLMGISGCFHAVREWRDWREDRDRGDDRYAEGARDHWVQTSPVLHEPRVER